MAIDIGGFHLIPDSLISVLVVAVVLAGIYIAYTGAPVRGKTYSAIAIITGTNIAVFLLQGIPLDSRLPVIPAFYVSVVLETGLVPAAFVHGDQWWAPLTQMFVHADVLHILFNMLFLWFVGPKVEERIGRHKFVVMYVLAGLAATAATLIGLALMPAAWQNIPFLNVPNWMSPNIGASGAVYGVIGFAIGAFPREKVLIPTPIIATYWSPPVAALILIVLNVFITPLFFPSTAWWAHLAGMVFGIIWGIRWRQKGPRVRIDSVTGWGNDGPVQYSYTYQQR